MNYLYGDSTPSKLTSNFLEFLRDATDFCVFVVQADERIKEGRTRIQKLREEAAKETETLERFIATVFSAIEKGEKGLPDSPTAHCATRVATALGEAQRTTIRAIEGRLAEDVAAIDADESATRKACYQALAALLLPHEPPDAKSDTRVALGPGGRYEATRKSHAELGLDWTIGLAIEDTSPWSTPFRVERIAPQLEIRAPQLTGWISKEVKVRPQKLERLIVTEIVDDGAHVRIQLRGEAAAVDAGFDLDLALATKELTAVRVGPAEDESVGPFEVHADDVAPVIALVEKLRASVGELGSVKLLEAKLDGTDFETQEGYIDIVQRLVTMMAPIVHDIAERSIQPHELIIRRLLGNDRREEIFVAKATLCEKYAVLDEKGRAYFAPLALEPPSTRTKTAEFPPTSVQTVRAELPRSAPPAPPVPSSAPPPRSTPRTNPPKPPPPRKPVPVDDAPEIELIEVRDSQPGEIDESPKNEALQATVKKIVTLTRAGRIDEAYQEYATLFSSPEFADARPDDQRQALRLMVLAKSPPPPNLIILEAHRAALARLSTLVTALKEPADYEMLGVAHIVLGDEASATKAFTEALAIERARDAGSELCGTLMRRVASI